MRFTYSRLCVSSLVRSILLLVLKDSYNTVYVFFRSPKCLGADFFFPQILMKIFVYDFPSNFSSLCTLLTLKFLPELALTVLVQWKLLEWVKA